MPRRAGGGAANTDHRKRRGHIHLRALAPLLHGSGDAEGPCVCDLICGGTVCVLDACHGHPNPNLNTHRPAQSPTNQHNNPSTHTIAHQNNNNNKPELVPRGGGEARPCLRDAARGAAAGGAAGAGGPGGGAERGGWVFV